MSASDSQKNGQQSRQQTNNKVAIIGMSCLFPGAADLASYWMNIIGGVDCIAEVPISQWEAARFYDPDSESFKDVYCKRGGFIDGLTDFDPLKYGVMPSTVDGADPDQFLALRVAVEAMKDAGYLERDFNRDRAEVLLGRTSAPGTGSLNLIQHGQTVQQVVDILSVQNPELDAEQLANIEQQLHGSLGPCNSDTISGVMPNVLAGRIAHRLGLRGKNLILDAACASSLLAVDMAVADLLSGQCDLVLAGGVHVNSNPFFYQMFCELGALSRNEQIRPFDENADGTMLGEGIGIVVLKRLEDAVRDGDRIYASIIGSGTSSDGRDSGPLAPSVEGESLAMQRAYEMAGISPSSVGLLEAHGTGTPAGDLAELQAILRVFGEAQEPWCAIGSVKSMIGHAQAASGIAGLIKSALALYHKVLPPTLNVNRPNPALNWRRLPCYINTQARPWVHPSWGLSGKPPRRAATSAFGFGGVNAHVVLEEYESGDNAPAQSLQRNWDCELIAVAASTSNELARQIDQLIAFIPQARQTCLRDIAYSMSCVNSPAHEGARLSLIAYSIADLLQKLKLVRHHLQAAPQLAFDGSDIYYRPAGAAAPGKLAYMLPGLGASYPNMLKELCLHFPEVRRVFDYVDDMALAAGESTPPSKRVFPVNYHEGANEISTALLASMDSAVVMLLMAEYAIYALLCELKIQPDAFMGCSTGEFGGITMSGAVDIHKVAPLFYNLSTKLAKSVPRDQLVKLCSIKVDGSYEDLEPATQSLSKPVYLAADMTPRHFIVSGEREAIDELGELLKLKGVDYHRLPVAIPYHTPLVQGVIRLEQKEVQQLPISAPSVQSWSCSTMSPYPDDVEVIRRITTDLFTKPIRFRETVESMYRSGVRTFVEIGPKGGLTELLEDVLSGREFTALPCDVPNRPSLQHLQTVLAKLWAAGVDMKLDCLFQRRGACAVAFEDLQNSQRQPIKRLSLSYPELKLAKPAQPAREMRPSEGRPSDAERRQPYTSVQQPDDGHLEPDPGAAVLQSYLSTLAEFHANLSKTQESVMIAYLQSAPPENSERASYAFLQDAIIERHGDAIHVLRSLELSKDRYLLDHAIGGVVSRYQGSPLRVHLLPLMVALEIMAEAASLMFPEQAIRAIRQVRAFKRIEVGNAPFDLKIEVRLSQDDQAQVHIFKAGEDQEQPLVSCLVEFGLLPQQAPPAVPVQLNAQRAASILPGQLYNPGFMFHGPTMQSVSSIDAVDQRGIAGSVQVRPASGWFSDGRQPEFLVDPLLLDNASQLVLFHLFEHRHPVIALLPFYIDSIEFHQPLAHLKGTATVQANLLAVTDKGTEAWLQISDGEGRAAATISGINSRRIVLSPQWLEFISDPARVTVSADLQQVACHLGDSKQWQCSLISGADLPADDSALEWLADYILSDSERRLWRKNRNDRRRREWLLGRIAAKDAVRALVRNQANIQLCPADIEIINDPDERPLVCGAFEEALGWLPEVSIAHCQDVAVALSAMPGARPGIDLELVAQRDKDFDLLAFHESERKLLEAIEAGQRLRAVTQLWCAKEALGKAFGMGLSTCLSGTCVRQADWAAGRFLLTASQGHAGQCYEVKCGNFKDFTIAVAAGCKVATSIA